MDQKNHFESPTTYYLHRAEYLVGLSLCVFLLLRNWHQVNWWHFAILFSYIDVIGYLPGAIAYALSPTKKISKVYFVLYNSTHSAISASAVAILWVTISGADWSLLAIPLHLCSDRSLFGNFLKPFILSFEPMEHPAFKLFKRNIGFKSDHSNGN